MKDSDIIKLISNLVMDIFNNFFNMCILQSYITLMWIFQKLYSICFIVLEISSKIIIVFNASILELIA